MTEITPGGSSVTRQIVQLLADLGFSEGEATAYVFLLQHSPATGYKVARSIGRSFSNAYQILESLERRGAVLVQGGTRRLHRAVPLDELLHQLDRVFQARRVRALQAAKRLSISDSDQHLYELKTIGAVYERCHTMLHNCEERALIELFPEPLEVLRQAVEDTAARGVVMAARIHQPAELRGVHVILSPYGAENLQLWGAQWLTLYVDGRQYLQANLMTGGGGVHHAIWSQNPYLSRALYSYVNSDLHHYAFRPHLKTAQSVEELRHVYEELQEIFPVGGDLGYQDLLRDMAEKQPSDTQDDTRQPEGGQP